jgi:hypothetical protein
MKGQVVTLGTSRLTAAGGAQGLGNATPDNDGGAGGVGRFHVDYSTSVSGSATPTIDTREDSTILPVSSDIKEFIGIAIGSVKKVLGIAIGNVKKLSGVSNT